MDVHAAVPIVPLQRTMVETDSPYLAPVPNRGKRNRPAWVPFVGARLAELHGVEVDEVRAATRANAEAAFGLS
jgi:TatD DNase family protein